MTITGRPWDELEDTLTIPRLEALYQEWRLHPPAHELFAAYIGYEAPLSTEEKWQSGAMGPDDFARWLKATGGSRLGPSG